MPEEGRKTKRTYKDSVFRMLFREKANLLSLYNAIYGTSYDGPEQMEITTLENAVYMGLKNDISCILDFSLALFEHQSTVNPNMPLRYLMYIADVYEKITAERTVYSSRQILLPAPDFVVLYNGKGNQPEKKMLLLSDAYCGRGKEDRGLELRVLQLNINRGYNEALKEKCPTLGEYCAFTDRVRGLEDSMPVSEAVDRAVKECIREGILKEFLLRNRAEVVKMSIYEYDEEKHMQALREEGREEGIHKIIYHMLENKRSPEDVSSLTGEPVEYVYRVQEEYLETVREKGSYRIKK